MAVGPLSISESTTGNLGDTITITCSTEFVPNPPPVADVSFGWFFGSENSTLPTDVIKSRITKNCYNSTCSSTLWFSPLLSTHAGIYTCHFYVIGGNIYLTASTLVLSQSPTTSSMASSNIAVVTAAMLIVIFIVIIVPVIVVAMIIYR